jgi:hypothetical protein
MGNCSSCCGNSDPNEIVTEKHGKKLKGVNASNPASDPLVDEI